MNKRGKVTEWYAAQSCDLCSNPATVRWTQDGNVIGAACSLHKAEAKGLLRAKHDSPCPECARSNGPHYTGPCEH